MAQALYTYRNVDRYDAIDASQWQAKQVSTISLMNFSGRILIGKFFLHSLPPRHLTILPRIAFGLC